MLSRQGSQPSLEELGTVSEAAQLQSGFSVESGRENFSRYKR